MANNEVPVPVEKVECVLKAVKVPLSETLPKKVGEVACEVTKGTISGCIVIANVAKNAPSVVSTGLKRFGRACKAFANTLAKGSNQ